MDQAEPRLNRQRCTKDHELSEISAPTNHDQHDGRKPAQSGADHDQPEQRDGRNKLGIGQGSPQSDNQEATENGKNRPPEKEPRAGASPQFAPQLAIYLMAHLSYPPGLS